MTRYAFEWPPTSSELLVPDDWPDDDRIPVDWPEDERGTSTVGTPATDTGTDLRSEVSESHSTPTTDAAPVPPDPEDLDDPPARPASPLQAALSTAAAALEVKDPDPSADDRKALVRAALTASQQAVDVIREALARGDADYDDAVRALPVLHRVLEHSERIAVAAREASSYQPVVVHLDFTGGNAVLSIEQEPKP
jgi:hypothetical protein